MRTFLRKTGAILLGLAVVVASGTALAAKKKKKKAAAAAPATGKASIVSVLETAGLAWGSTIGEVKELYKKKIRAEFDARIKETKDAYAIYNLGKEKDAKLAEIDKAYVKFEASKKGAFRSAIVNNEFTWDGNEAMLVIPTGKSQWYLFFVDDKLWKLFIAYNTDYIGDRSFSDIIDMGGTKYGKPKKLWHRKIRLGDPKLVAGEWEDKDSRLWMEDKTALFGSVVMIYQDKKGRKDDRSEVINPLPKMAKSTYAPSDDMIDSLKEEGPASSEDVVDRITGTDSYSDLDGLESDTVHGMDRSAAVASGEPGAAKKKGKKKGKKTTKTTKKKTFDDDLIF